MNEMASALGLDKRNLVKKLREWESEGIFNLEKRGNAKTYYINEKHPLYNEYRKIVLSTVGLEARLKRLLKGTRGVTGAVLYGSYAEDRMGPHSDVDLLVVGDHSIVDLQRKLNVLQRETGREINAVHMGKGEFEKRRALGDPFVTGIFERKHIPVV